jgi:Cellulose biosynthesis protein BcsN
MKRLCLALFALCLAGCSSNEGLVARYDALGADRSAPTSRAITSEDFFVHIPEWAGAATSARQSNEGAVLRQTIALVGGTHGEHTVEVAVETREGVDRSLPALHAPSEAEIAEELRAKFPGVAMHVLAGPMSDAAGRYNLAIGRAGDGARCLYAWRWTEDLRVATDPSGIASVAAMFSHKARPASLRIRLCTKYVTLDDLASLAQQIHFIPTFEMDKILAEPVAVASAAQRADAGLFSSPLESAIPLVATAENTVTREPRHVSSPSLSKRRLAHHRRRQQPVVADAAPRAPMEPGPRYLAPPPVDGSQSTAAATIFSAGSGVASPIGQGLNLPAAALRGPPVSANPRAAQAPAAPE